MRTQRVKIYKFDELNAKAQQKAIEYFNDLNVDFDWWAMSIYPHAEAIGLKITSFDIDQYCKGEFTEGAYYTAREIAANHGDKTRTYATAFKFIEDWAALVKKHSDGIQIDKVAKDNEFEFDSEADELEKEFLKSLCEDYRIMLQKEYEYLTSREAIEESIRSNEYEFTADGKFWTVK